MKQLVPILLLCTFAFSQNKHQNADMFSSPKTPTHNHDVCISPMFTNEFIVAMREKMRTQYPDEYQRMLMPRTLNKTYSVGMTEKFWVNVDDGNGGSKQEEITAQLLAKGNNNAIWADVNQISENNNIDNDTAIEYLEFLEQKTPAASRDSTKGSWELMTTYFGNEPNYDGDGITDYLFADLFSGAAGYFSPGDQSNQSGSNKRDILYIDCNVSKTYAMSTISHEHQHLIHYNYRGKGTTFNEGMSEMAIVIAGLGTVGFNPNAYLSNVGNIGWAWEGTSANYAMGGLFVLYFAEQLGDASLLKFQEIDASGWTAFQRLLNIYETGLSYKSWIQNWHIANYLNDKSTHPAYGYDWPYVGKANASKWHSTGQVQSDQLIIKNYDTNYIFYSSSADSLPITFTATGVVPNYLSLEFTDDTMTVKTLEDTKKHLVKDDKLKVNKAVFVVSNINGSDATYSYKSEGANTGGWFASTEIKYDDGEVDAFTASGSNFGYLGWGRNNAGQGWGMDFDPLVKENQLVSTSINLGFAQDFSSGTDIPASVDKDFDLHIWRIIDDNGGVENILPPIKFDGKAAGITGTGFVNIDLSEYSEQLTNLGKIVIGVVDDDTVGTYFGLSSDEPVNHTYAFNYNGSGGLAPMSDFNIGGAGLDGWNFMFRTTWLVKNTVAPNLHAGFMQHSVFNDVMKIYIIGNSVFDDETLNIYLDNDGEIQSANVAPMVSSDSILVADYKLTKSGSLDIRVTGNYLYSTILFDSTFKYNVTYADQTKPVAISSRDGVYSINLAEKSFDEETYVIIGKNGYISSASIDHDEILSDIYSVGPLQKELSTPAQISFDLNNINPNDVSVAYWDGELWRELNSFVSSDQSILYANTKSLGHFALIPKGSGMPLSTDEELLIPTEYALEQNYPNPFNPETRIHYDIASGGNVSMVIYDILGRKIVELINQYQPPGRYDILWNGNDALCNPVGSGVYLYQLKSGHFSKTKKMVISR